MRISTKRIANICVTMLILILAISVNTFAYEGESGWSLNLATNNNSAVYNGSEDVLIIDNVPYIYTRTAANFFNMTLGWIGSEREISFTYKNKMLKAVVDTSTCTINDEVLNLINPIIMSSGRTYISAADLSLLDLDVVVNNKTKAVTIETPRANLNDIIWTKEGGCDVVLLTFSRDVTFTKSILSLPDRLLIDIADAKYDASITIPVGESKILTKIRLGENLPRTIRVVFDLTLSAAANITHEGNVIKVKFNNPISEAQIVSVDDVESVVLTSEEYINCPAVIRTGDNIYYYDLSCVTLLGGNRELLSEKENSGIEWVKVAQFDTNTVRLAIKLKEDFILSHVATENLNEFKVDVNSNVKLETPDSQKYLEDLIEEGLKAQLEASLYQQTVVVIKSETPVEFSLFRLKSPDRIVVDMKNVHVNKVTTNLSGPEDVVTSLRTSQFDSDTARVVLDADATCSVEYVINEDNTEMTITLNTSNIAGKVIIIDPGHGGTDGGTSYEDAVEKKINLAVAEKLRDLLVGAGATVIMTRDTDIHVSLTDRSTLANAVMPDAFVSIHSNAAWNVDAYGAESYYLNLEFFSKPLAQSILSEMIKVTGQKSRGAKSENFHVVRETFMPSTLVELGFITNTAERVNLLNPEFQDKLAIGIFNGLEVYFASETYSKWSKLRALLLDTKLLEDPKAVSDTMDLVNVLLKEYKINADAVKYITPTIIEDLIE